MSAPSLQSDCLLIISTAVLKQGPTNETLTKTTTTSTIRFISFITILFWERSHFACFHVINI